MVAAAKPPYLINYDVVKAQFDKIKKDIVYFRTPAQLQQYLQSGSVDMAMALTTRLAAAAAPNQALLIRLGGAKYANGVAAGGDERWGYGCESGDEDTDDEAGSSEGHIEGFVSRPGEEKSDSCSD